jgi:hypothetical protein
MGQLFTKTNNYIQYKIFKATDDPGATAFAKQQKAEADAAAAKVAKDTKVAEEKKKADEQQAKNLKKAQYSGKTFIGQIISYAITAFLIFLFILFALYTGHLAANDAIGRPVEYRILFFIYGALFSLFVFPYYIVQRFRGNIFKSYAILPVREGPVPEGLEGFFLSFVSFMPDENYAAAKRAYEQALEIAARA